MLLCLLLACADDGMPEPNDAADAAVAAADTTVTIDGSTAAAPHDSVLVGYYPAWATHERDYQVGAIPASRVTHVNYGFANIADGKCVLGDKGADTQKLFAGDTAESAAAGQAGNFNQLRKLRAHNPALRTLISVGGFTWSGSFSDVALSARSRALFVNSCVDFAVQYGFDGIDIDWEFPGGGGLDGNAARPEDKQNYTLLLRALRDALRAKQREVGRGEPFLLTIAAPSGPDLVAHLDGSGIAESVDWINVMAYDFHGTWDNQAGHNAPLMPSEGDSSGFSASAAIEGYRAQGVPANKLVLGVPFYGRSFAGVRAGAHHGLDESSVGPGPGTWENGVLDYKDIAAHYLNMAGYVRYEDEAAQVPYLFNAQKGVLISYDDPTSLAQKAGYARANGLRGTMIWDLSSDTAEHALLSALAAP